MGNRAGRSRRRIEKDKASSFNDVAVNVSKTKAAVSEKGSILGRELTSEEREILADLYHFISHHDEKECLAEMKEEKYKTLLNVDITARYCICDSWEKYERLRKLRDNDPVDAVECMIRTGYCPHDCLPKGKTKLMSFQIIHLAAIYGMTCVLEYLLTSCKVKVNCLTGRSKLPPVFYAVFNGNETTALYLLDHPNRVIFPNTLLVEATSNGCDRVVERLLRDKTCDVNAMDENGTTALMLAVRDRPMSQDTNDLVTLMIEAGCDVNIKDYFGETALFDAIEHKDFGMVEILLKAGASVNAEDNKGMCTLIIAIFQRTIEITELILEAGADPNSRTERGDPALIIASEYGDVDMMRLLLKHKADVNAIDLANRHSALHVAAWYGHQACVECLLEAGASPDQRSTDGNTPMSLATQRGHPDVIDMLLPLGCDVTNADNDLDTPLHYAAFNGCLKTVAALGVEGADVNARNACNATPLWNAVHKGHTNVVRYLVRKNVELNVPSRGIDYLIPGHVYIYDDPKTPLAMVFDNTWTGDDILIELLLMAGYDIWHEKGLIELTTTPISPSPDVQTVFQTITSHVFTPPSLFHLCKMSLRNTHKMRLEEFMGKQKIPPTITNNIILEGIEKCSQKIPLESFGKMF